MTTARSRRQAAPNASRYAGVRAAYSTSFASKDREGETVQLSSDSGLLRLRLARRGAPESTMSIRRGGETA